jgi:O-succinylbenzoic acid--CoA ligase
VSSLRPVSGTADELLAALRDWDAAGDPDPLVVATSGSTGRPKGVVLSRRAMRASVDATHNRLGGPGQWLLDLPPTHVAGVQVLFRSVRAATEPVVDSDLVRAVGVMGPGRRYLSLVPTQLVRALRRPPELDALATLSAVLVGGGPLHPRVRRAAEDAGVPVVQTYGMSESCGGCVYDGVPLDGVRVRIDDGQVLLAGPVLFDGYEGEPERTADVLAHGWLRTADLGRLVEGGRLRIEGRVDDVVISGGVKVPALAVQRMLEQHPDVVEAAVLGVPDAEWGERVVAVVPAPAPALAELRDLVTPRAWAPRQLVVVESLPRLPNSKLDRLALRRLVPDA